MLQFNVNTSGVKKLIKNFQRIGGEGKQFFNLLGIEIDKMTQVNFRMLGARSGHEKWRPLSLLSIHPSWKANNSEFPEYKGRRYNPAKWNRRRGTDNAKGRRFNEASNNNILQASGEFKRSFKILQTTNNNLKYGTMQRIGDVKTTNIIGDREVLFVNEKDSGIIGRMFLNFIKKKIGF